MIRECKYFLTFGLTVKADEITKAGGIAIINPMKITPIIISVVQDKPTIIRVFRIKTKAERTNPRQKTKSGFFRLLSFRSGFMTHVIKIPASAGPNNPHPTGIPARKTPWKYVQKESTNPT